MDPFTLEDITLCVRRASQWKVVKKTGTYEASVSDFKKSDIRVGRGYREVFLPYNTREFSFTREQLDAKDPRIAETLDTLNALYSGADRRKMMAKSLRYSYFIWNRPTPFTNNGQDAYISQFKMIGPNFKDKTDFYMIFDYISALHTPANPIEVKPGVKAMNNFTIAAPIKTTYKGNLKDTDIASKNPGFKERVEAGLALQLDKYALNQFVLKTNNSESATELPLDFTEDIEFSF